MRAYLLVTSFVLTFAMALAAPDAYADEPAEAASDSDARDRSRTAFRKGVAHLRAREWAPARASFESAWSLYPHPSILLNLAIARLHTDDAVRAEQDLVRFLSEDARASTEELATAREALAEARARIGTLKVVVSPPIARVSVDGKPVATVQRAEGPMLVAVADVRIKPGHHLVTAEAEGHAGARRDVEIVAKAEALVRVPLATDAAPVRSSGSGETSTRNVVGWSLVGLAGASLVTGAVVAVRAKSLADDYADRTTADFQNAGVRSEGIRLRTVADIALGVAVLSGGVAAILLFTDLGKSGAAPTSARGVRVKIPRAGSQACGVLCW